MTDLVGLFQGIGLTEKAAKETVQNKKISANLAEIIAASGNSTHDKQIGALLYQLASTSSNDTKPHFPLIATAISDRKLQTSDQVSAAIKYCNSIKNSIDVSKFNEACGVGVIITNEQIEETVRNLLVSKKDELEKKRWAMLGLCLGNLKSQLRWANGIAVKDELEKQLLSLLGPKDERDDPKKKEKKKADNDSIAPTPERSVVELASSTKFVFEGEMARLHKPGENPQLRPEIMAEHLKRTGGKVITRFPPEPNGFLHIGHAKAINISFGYAQAHNGITNLRYDDTNPEAEEKEYFDAIKDMVEWLGYKPSAVTYSSDHFQRLYDLAVELIKRDKAYVCHCTGEQIHQQRGGDEKGPRYDCPHRSRPIQESITEFENMKNGKYKEGEATLRMKMDMQSPNPQFWDLIAYRVMYIEHIRTGKDWVIYPTYDYTHCLCDSFEDITHSLCTTEFTMSRESYYWLVDALEIYKPVQWEFGRLSVTHTITSKRKLNVLVTDGHVNGWDDPRLYTLAGLKRRGFTPEAINAFCRELGVTTALTSVPPERLEHYVRDHLNQIAPRLFLVLDPLKVTITNYDKTELLTVQNKPKDDSLGVRTLPFTKTIYIDSSDFREEDDPNYFRLAPGKTVGLLNAPRPIKATSVIKDANGKIIEVLAEMVDAKPKTYIQWVAHSPEHHSPVKVQVRLVNKLFIHPNPSDNKDGWLKDVNPESLVTVDGYVDTGVLNLKTFDKFQGVRLGYFCVDPDTTKDVIVLNRTVTLKEDSKKDK